MRAVSSNPAGFCIGAILTAITFGSGCHMTSAPPDAHQTIDVGIQVYSFRGMMEKDVPGTLDLVQKMGVTDVELGSLYGHSAEDFRKELDKRALHASGIHFQWDRFSKDLHGLIKDAKSLGCEYVTLPWIPHNGDFTLADVTNAAASFNEWGKICAEAGLKFTYHAHGYEFRPHETGTFFDLLATSTDSKYVNFELDIFWAYDGGADPAQLLHKYPTRFPQMHLKDMRKDVHTPNYTGHENVECDVTLGTGQLDLPGILKEAEKVGVKHYYIEDESSRSKEQVPQSIRYIRSIGL